MQSRTASSPGRRRWLLCPIAAACATVALAGAAPATAPVPTYRVIPLNANGAVEGINAKDQVAFTAYEGDVTRARFYDGSTIRDLGTFGGPNAVVYGLNDLGQVVGTASTGVDAPFHAFRWSRQTGLVDLNAPGVGNSIATDINNKGQVAGLARFGGTLPDRAFRWSPGTGMVNLGALGPTSSSNAFGINDAGTVVGWSDEAQGPRLTQVTKWPGSGGGPIALNDFPSIASLAEDINNAGQIVGSAAFDARGHDQAFIWTPQGGLQDLGTEPAFFSFANRINEKGLVIGGLRVTPPDSNGFIWSREHGLLVIGTPGVDRSDATALNNRGQVVGFLNTTGYIWTRSSGFVDLSSRVVNAPPGMTLFAGLGINDNGTIVAGTNTGTLVLLVPRAVHHQAPVAGAVNVTGAARPNALLSFSAGFTDVDAADTHKAVWSWGDGTTTAGTVSSKNGTGSVSGQHAYRKSGIYTVRLTITDSGGKSSTVERKVVICAAQAAAISGQGSFAASAFDPGSTGSAGTRRASVGSFAFLSEGPGAGQVHVNVAGLALRSSQVDAVTVDGPRIRYSGHAAVNGKAGYRFALTVTRSAKAGGKDRIHVRIVHSETGSNAEVVDYDNGNISGNAGGSGAAASGSARQAASGAEGSMLLDGRIGLDTN